MSNPSLATEEQLTELFGVDTDTVRRWRKQGLAAVGDYSPKWGKPTPLFSVAAASRFHRKEEK
ncbi:HTH DNA binding protein [Mycobacterium phage Alvin]|uniref:HTH DNA binding protein n=1 Tax=Mycobacterium phage Alvin TaxID=1567466 RepID=UPI000588E456|nr:HTH DNA binding protein [Mycobacterium phage Alvin]YP_009283318.1 HTH DNA binding protein [Mycobacterium phage Papez]AJD82572.1 helix-turn-helix DNA binding domain protein [Mycobacterium phage Alvin]ANT42038.1 helix-turn-helix DNA binding domain protein [Mycobacterium phage Papez]